MSLAKRPRAWFVCLLPFLLTTLAMAPAAWSQNDPAGRPRNSHLRGFGNGWECDRGYTQIEGSCVAISVPAHAFLDSFGDGWECDRGYREVEEACEAVVVPARGLLDFTGHGWTCSRGFQKAA